MERAAAGLPIVRRQDTPPESFWEAEQAMRRWHHYGSEFMIVLSYAWCNPEHPDRDCFHLFRLAKMLAITDVARGGWEQGQEGCVNTAGDRAIFWDFVSPMLPTTTVDRC